MSVNYVCVFSYAITDVVENIKKDFKTILGRKEMPVVDRIKMLAARLGEEYHKSSTAGSLCTCRKGA